MSTLASVVQKGVFASRPAASIAGLIYYSTDTGKIYRDNGATWDDVTPSGSGSIVSVLGIVIDGGGTSPPTGAKGFVQVPYACTLTGWTIIADQSGSAQITVSKGTFAAFPTMSSIVASSPPILSSAQKSTSTTLTGWTTAISSGDILSFNLDSLSTIQRIILELQVTRP
jgi:hypothetical protein